MLVSAHARSLPHMSTSTNPSGLSGYSGTPTSNHVPTRVVRSVQLDPEVSVVEHDVPGPVTGVGGGERDVVANEVLPDDRRVGSVPLDDEQPLACGHMNETFHSQPPDSACMT